MRIAVFLALLLIAAGYAVWRGGGPERVMAVIASLMVMMDVAVHHVVPPAYASLDTGHLIIDLFGAVTTTALALKAHRFWPMGMAVLHILPLLAHSSRALDLAMHPAAYLVMQVAPSWLVAPVLIGATWHHHRRLEESGSDPSWSRARA
ncbi:hypothetical protein GCM10010833_08280 [Blastomonas aquatica]|uniref:Rod shape-determining protein MreD n=2 Tax=Blastomonas aquatica TaxID=1510276 RepID=A0ABQ1IZL2_9SPHN|nr:hypothetical protein [Blastomonas aquatica]GGB55915.1 hypothetical protein GCM10010833_08280 [Blastomonas aquatica]